jgi:hypothetical protein
MQKSIFRSASLLLLVSLVLGTTLALHTAGASAALASSATFNPVANAYVIQSAPKSNYGSNTALRVDGSPVTRRRSTSPWM